MSKRTFEFYVEDAEGVWGMMKIRTPTEAEARRQVREILLADEVEPKGLLLSKFRLRLKKR